MERTQYLSILKLVSSKSSRMGAPGSWKSIMFSLLGAEMSSLLQMLHKMAPFINQTITLNKNATADPRGKQTWQDSDCSLPYLHCFLIFIIVYFKF